MMRLLPLPPKPADKPGGSWEIRKVLVRSCGSPCDGMPREPGQIRACAAVCVRVYRQDWEHVPTGTGGKSADQLRF